MGTAKSRATKVASYFLSGDGFIAEHERAFDSVWEQGDGNKVAEQFRILYNTDAILRLQCSISRYFCPAMVACLIDY